METISFTEGIRATSRLVKITVLREVVNLIDDWIHLLCQEIVTKCTENGFHFISPETVKLVVTTLLPPSLIEPAKTNGEMAVRFYPLPGSEVAELGVKYQISYAFEARNPDELSIMPGDIVLVPQGQCAETGWLVGDLRGKTGWFPESHAEKMEGVAETHNSDFNGSRVGPGAKTVHIVGPLEGISEAPENTVEADKAVKDVLQHSENSSFTQFPKANQVTSPTSAESPVLGESQAVPDGLQAQAQFPWKAKKENHLSFNKGDIIVVKEQQDMWYGEFQGQLGWFPKSYVKLISGPSRTNDVVAEIADEVPQQQEIPTQPLASSATTSHMQMPVSDAILLSDLKDDRLLQQTTFEDERRENFGKGQAELEKRKPALLESQRKEQEERDRKERGDQERRERIRQEQEKRRQFKEKFLEDAPEPKKTKRETAYTFSLPKPARGSANFKSEPKENRLWMRFQNSQFPIHTDAENLIHHFMKVVFKKLVNDSAEIVKINNGNTVTEDEVIVFYKISADDLVEYLHL